MISLQDQVVWITGASSGIGEALAYAFANRGAKLILSSRREEELRRVKKNCSLPDEHVLIVPLDVAETEKIPSAVQTVLSHFKRIDILVNNAGVSHWTKVKDLSVELIQRIMNVNFIGGAALTHEVLPGMLERKQGSIIVISSVLGKMPVRKQAAYVASKYALQGFYDTLRLEVAGDGVHVLVVCPGFVRTNVAKNSLNKEGVAINQDNEKIKSGLDPSYVAERILQSLDRKKNELVIAGKPEKTALWMKRFFPSAFTSMMSKRKLL